jgi:hypothetical protein
MKDQLTKAIHRDTLHTGPVWCKGAWRSFVFDTAVWRTYGAECDRDRTRLLTMWRHKAATGGRGL